MKAKKRLVKKLNFEGVQFALVDHELLRVLLSRGKL